MLTIHLSLSFFIFSLYFNIFDAITISGNSEIDLPTADNNTVILFDGLDVGVPPAWPFEASGWDMKDIRIFRDFSSDTLYFAINCYGVCGDADGDGDADNASLALVQRGGQDLPHFAKSESCAIAIDIGSSLSQQPDGTFDFVLGYPAQRSSRSDRFPCDTANDQSCFGLYRYDNGTGSRHLGQRFIWRENDLFLKSEFCFLIFTELFLMYFL